MFENFSTRALQVVFTARVTAGERGADALDVGDLVTALLLEDQNRIRSFLAGALGAEGGEDSMQLFEPHAEFFSAESASDLLVGVEGLLSHSSPIPTSADMPVSPNLSRVFELTEQLRNNLHHKQVHPLHFLAAILDDNTSEFGNLFGRAGITQETVLARLEGKPS
jgi:hypothetical protein